MFFANRFLDKRVCFSVELERTGIACKRRKLNNARKRRNFLDRKP